MKKALNLVVLVVFVWSCTPQIACPDLSSTYQSTRKEKPRLVRTKKVQQQTESVELASLESSAVPIPRPELRIAATKKQLEWIEIEKEPQIHQQTSNRQKSGEVPTVAADTTITPWAEADFEEIKRAQKRGRTSLILGLLFPVVLFIPFVNFIALPLAIGGVVLGTMSLKTFKKYQLKGARGKLAAVLGTVINWAWIILSVAAVLILIWLLLAYGTQ